MENYGELWRIMETMLIFASILDVENLMVLMRDRRNEERQQHEAGC